MTTLNISLPDSMRAFVNEQIAQGSYGTASEYIRQLIREAQEREAQKRLESLLLEALESGKFEEVTDEWWQRKRAALVEGYRKGREG